jgi:mono/diheme cytochrome c family protein
MKRIALTKTALVLTAATCAFAAASRSTRDGVYTKAQATRGQTIYNEECAKCHGQNLSGGEGAPALAGGDFMARWQGKPLDQLFEVTRTTMPADDPGHLSRRQTADVIAWMLSSNELPSGEKDLDSSAESLADIRLEAKK